MQSHIAATTPAGGHENAQHIVFPLSGATAIGSCFALAALFVASLYVWKPYGPCERDLPANVKRRFLSVSVSMLLSPLLVFYLLHDTATFTGHSVCALMGLRLGGLLTATILPLLLTAILFAGPLTVQLLNDELLSKATIAYWRCAVTDILWIRNHIMAPISEEFTFRACMMPLLLHAFGPASAILLTPLFFGVAHLHHAVERHRNGMPAAQIALISAVQMTYTSVFGCYSAYLFARTGHYVAPVAAHAFCNHMGVPNVSEVWHEPDAGRRWRMAGAYVAGAVAFAVLLPVLTQPLWYGNVVYWQE